MIELGISQAQSQFTKILNQTVIIVDKKSHHKKAVIMPYEEYNRLINIAAHKSDFSDGAFNQFIGLLDNDFSTNDEKYNQIIK
jgi:hypothetical protein